MMAAPRAMLVLLMLAAAPRQSGSPMHRSAARAVVAGAAAACGCADFCAGRCAFNATAPQTLRLFRRTLSSDLRLADHDTGSAVGDAEFSLYSFSCQHARNNGSDWISAGICYVVTCD